MMSAYEKHYFKKKAIGKINRKIELQTFRRIL